MKLSEFTIGKMFTTDPVSLSKKDILDFGKQYDPQYFHIDEEAAEESPYGSLIASGFQTLAVVWAEWIKIDVLGRECLGGIGMNTEWSAPVLPNDQLTGYFTVTDSKKVSDGTRGIVTFEIIIKNQKERKVLKGNTNIFIQA